MTTLEDILSSGPPSLEDMLNSFPVYDLDALMKESEARYEALLSAGPPPLDWEAIEAESKAIEAMFACAETPEDILSSLDEEAYESDDEAVRFSERAAWGRSPSWARRGGRDRLRGQRTR